MPNPAAEHLHPPQSVRHRLPKKRSGFTQEARIGGREPVHPLADHAKRVDVEARIDLVEYRELRTKQRQLNRLVALLLAARQVDVERTIQQRRR